MSGEDDIPSPPDDFEDLRPPEPFWDVPELCMQSSMKNMTFPESYNRNREPLEIYNSIFTPTPLGELENFYTDLNRIGKGTFGTVFKARHKVTNELVAIKQIAFTNEKEGVPISALREIYILSSHCHENIVKLLDILVSSDDSFENGKGYVYLVFEYMHHDLTGLLDTHWDDLSLEQIKSFIQQLFRGILFCHQRKVLHRDIKGSNLLINKEGILKLADFGLARLLPFGNRANHLTNRVITLWYRPPEILLGSTAYSKACDIWSIGCILAEMLSGKPLLMGNSEVSQIELIFKMFGTPITENWESAKDLDFYSLLQPKEEMKRSFRENFKGKYVTEDALDLLDLIFVLDPEKRITASQALQHPYFRNIPLPRKIPLDGFEESHELQSKDLRKKRHKRPSIPSPSFSPPSKIQRIEPPPNIPPPVPKIIPQRTNITKPTKYKPVVMKNSGYQVPIKERRKGNNGYYQAPLPPPVSYQNEPYNNPYPGNYSQYPPSQPPSHNYPQHPQEYPRNDRDWKPKRKFKHKKNRKYKPRNA